MLTAEIVEASFKKKRALYLEKMQHVPGECIKVGMCSMHKLFLQTNDLIIAISFNAAHLHLLYLPSSTRQVLD
jgi:hypothetical protein